MSRIFSGFIGLVMVAGQAQAEFRLEYADNIRVENASLVAIGDVTGDGKSEIVTIVGDEVYVYERLPDGDISEPRKYRYTGSGWADHAADLKLADVNNDGVLDVIVGGTGTLAMTVLKSNKLQPGQLGLEIFTNNYMQYQDSGGMAVADVNSDGFPDVVQAIPNFYSYLRQWRGRKGTLIDRSRLVDSPASYLRSSTQGFSSVHMEDMDGDGLEDLVIPSASSAVFSIYYKDKVHGYASNPVKHGRPSGSYFAVGDFNGDGLGDVATSAGYNSPTSVELQLQQASANFTAVIKLPAADQPMHMQGEDIDGDGDDDLVVLHPGGFQGGAIGLYLQAQGGLQPETRYGNSSADRFAIGDWNGDGCKDVIYSSWNPGLTVYHGIDCQNYLGPADLSVALAGSATAVSVGLANGPGTESIESPLVQLDLAVRLGTLQTGALPAGCVIQSQTARSQRIECLVETMAPEATASLTIPVGFTGTGKPGALVATVQAQTNTREKSTSNNRAWRQFTQQAVIPSLAPGQAGSVGARPRPAALPNAPRSHSVHGNTKKRKVLSSGVTVERKPGKASLMQENGTGTWHGP